MFWCIPEVEDVLVQLGVEQSFGTDFFGTLYLIYFSGLFTSELLVHFDIFFVSTKADLDVVLFNNYLVKSGPRCLKSGPS